jgi:two-component system, cell cycle response regulator DivK
MMKVTMTDNAPQNTIPDIKDWVILIIDDQEDNLVVSSMALSFQGAQVQTASNALDGIDKMLKIRPTLVLMDLSMPRIDGWEALRMIRGNPDTASIPVVALTAHAMGGDKERILQAGFNGYIAKPFEVYALADGIRQILRTVYQKPATP